MSVLVRHQGFDFHGLQHSPPAVCTLHINSLSSRSHHRPLHGTVICLRWESYTTAVQTQRLALPAASAVNPNGALC